MRKTLFATVIVILTAGLFASVFITGCQANHVNFTVPDEFVSSKYLYPETLTYFTSEPEIAVTVDSRILRSGSGNVNEAVFG